MPTIPRGKSNYFFIFFNYLSFIVFGSLVGAYKLRKKKFDVILVFASSPIFQIIVGYVIKLFKNAKLVTFRFMARKFNCAYLIKNKFFYKYYRSLTSLTYNLE